MSVHNQVCFPLTWYERPEAGIEETHCCLLLITLTNKKPSREKLCGYLKQKVSWLATVSNNYVCLAELHLFCQEEWLKTQPEDHHKLVDGKSS